MRKFLLLILTVLLLSSCAWKVKYSDLPDEKKTEISKYIYNFSKDTNLDDLLENYPNKTSTEEEKIKYINAYKTEFSKLLSWLELNYKNVDFQEIKTNYENSLKELKAKFK